MEYWLSLRQWVVMCWVWLRCLWIREEGRRLCGAPRGAMAARASLAAQPRCSVPCRAGSWACVAR